MTRVDAASKTTGEVGLKKSSGIAEDRFWLITMIPCLIFTYFFGRYFPPLTAFLTGPQLYTWVGYKYDEKTIFDNTILTYGTDYILAVTHGFLTYRLCTVKVKKVSALQVASTALVASFAISTLAGAISHQFLWHDLNTWYFRLVWRICVGSVGAAGGALGMCGSELARLPLKEGETKTRLPVPIPPTYFWVVWGFFFYMVIYVGLYSMRNPACDIFLTGVTQTPPTFYVVYVLLSRSSWDHLVKQEQVYLLAVGLLANALLLPGYDLLNYLKLRDGVCNVFLHTMLFCAWSAQGISLRSFVVGREALLENKQS